jgi:hypothetical protein
LHLGQKASSSGIFSVIVFAQMLYTVFSSHPPSKVG